MKMQTADKYQFDIYNRSSDIDALGARGDAV